MKMPGSFLWIKVLLVLILAFFTNTVYAYDTSQSFYGLNQAEIRFYEDALRIDPAWAQRAKIFDGMKLDDMGWKEQWDNHGVGYYEDYSLVSFWATMAEMDRFDTRISIPEDLKFVGSDGYVLGDEVCVGDTFTLSKGENRGEFWLDGGAMDTPPVYWVDDVEELAYSLVKTKVQKHKAMQTTYPRTPLKKIFSLSGLLYYATNDTPNLLNSNEQQADLRKYLKETGYVKESDQLVGAQYSTPDYDINDPSSLKYILITKGGSEIGRIHLTNSLYPDNLNGTGSDVVYGSHAVVMLGGKEIATFLLDYQFDAFIEAGAAKGSIIDPLTGIPVYRLPNMGVDGAVVCSMKGGISVRGAVDEGGGNYKITSKDSAGYTGNYLAECMFYFYGMQGTGAFGGEQSYFLIQMPAVRIYDGKYLDMIYCKFDSASFTLTCPERIAFNPTSVEELFRAGGIYLDKTWQVVEPAKPGIVVSFPGAENIKFGESNNLRALVKNTGNVNILFKSINSRPVGKIVSCDFDVLSPGKEGECLFSVAPRLGEGVYVQFSYNYKSCGRGQVGLVSKTLIESSVFTPVLSEQAYSIGVHGGCENSYYACQSASGGGTMSAGYKCYKTSAGFYTPAVERFMLGFDLSGLPKDKQISGAKLHLAASSVNRAQSISVYSVSPVSEVNCVPGGDVCTQPYCGECAQVFDVKGSIISSVDVSVGGDYVLDLASAAKDAIGKGGKLYLQIRGAEDTWTREGETSCKITDGWDQRDAVFNGGADGPYLEIIYK